MAGALGSRRGQMLVELAVVLPLFVMLALLAGTLSDYGTAGLKAQEAARLMAWKGTAKARPALPPSLRLEQARCGAAAVRAPRGWGSQDPLLGGWAGKALGTSKAEVELSSPALPWGGPRLKRSAVHVVDLGRPAKGMDRWVRERIGAREPGR